MNSMNKYKRGFAIRTCLLFWLWLGRNRVDASEISRNQSLFCQTEPSGPETLPFSEKHQGPIWAPTRPGPEPGPGPQPGLGPNPARAQNGAS